MKKILKLIPVLLIIASLFLVAFRPMLPFGQSATVDTETLIVFVVSLIAGALGMPLIDWLKHKLKLKSVWALVLSYVVSIVIAFLALFATGSLGLASFTGEAFFIAMGTVISTANFVYKLFNPVAQGRLP